MKLWLTSRNICLLLLIGACMLILLSIGCEKSEDGKEESEGIIESDERSLGVKSMPQNQKIGSTNPVISVAFVGEPKLKSSNTLRIQVENVLKRCILMVTIAPDVDIVSSKPIPPEGCRELSGFPLAHKIEPSDDVLEISYPAFIFEKEYYLPPGDSRDITGWIVEACLVDEVLATPIKIPRYIGDLHVIRTDEIPKGWYLLCSEISSEEFDKDAEFDLLAIPGSNAGVFFYVRETELITSITQEFDADFLEH